MGWIDEAENSESNALATPPHDRVDTMSQQVLATLILGMTCKERSWVMPGLFKPCQPATPSSEKTPNPWASRVNRLRVRTVTRTEEVL